jgi:hypothetical protein
MVVVVSRSAFLCRVETTKIRQKRRNDFLGIISNSEKIPRLEGVRFDGFTLYSASWNGITACRGVAAENARREIVPYDKFYRNSDGG